MDVLLLALLLLHELHVRKQDSEWTYYLSTLPVSLEHPWWLEQSVTEYLLPCLLAYLLAWYS